MDRNDLERFGNNPQVDIQRSKFSRQQDIKTTFNTGELIPFYVDEVLPGDTHKIRTNKVVRLQTPLTPFMDNLMLDTYYFYVPSRLVWSNFKYFMGESNRAWLPDREYVIPQIKAPSGGFDFGTIADYMGLPPKVDNIEVSALPFRAYAKIVEDWFRYTPLQEPLNIPVGDSTQEGSNGDDYITDIANGGKPFIARKYADYFVMGLPSPQRGEPVQINLGEITGSVFGNGYSLGLTNGSEMAGLSGGTGGNAYTSLYGASVGSDATGALQNKGVGVPTADQLGEHPEYSGLVAQISGGNLISISELRSAFQIQKWFEALARGGDRMVSILSEMFGVTSPDARLQRSEYLGGNRVPINVNSIVNTSDSLGKTGAYSVTADTNFDFEKSFVEPGYIIGLMCVRYNHTYSQGIEKFWSRKTKFQFYWPQFANLSEMPIYNKEIFASGSQNINPNTGKAYDEEVFAYQEAWADYRYKPNRLCNEMRPSHPTSLDIWHLGDDYEELPHLSAEWIKEDKANVDRILSVTSNVSNQIFADVYVENECIRPMPLYSIPGLLDHH